jgi:hypothetical protein
MEFPAILRRLLRTVLVNARHLKSHLPSSRASEEYEDYELLIMGWRERLYGVQDFAASLPRNWQQCSNPVGFTRVISLGITIVRPTFKFYPFNHQEQSSQS